MSGWSQRSVAIIAPRRRLVSSSVRQVVSQMAMNDTGPEARPPVSAAGLPRGRSVEKSKPTPPPCCIVIAPSRSAARIPSSESSIGPITKQLNSVTRLALPAPAMMRPPGRNAPLASSAWKRAAWRAR